MIEAVKVTVVEFGDRKCFQMQWRDPRTGKKKTKSTGVLRTGRKPARTEAERVAAQHEAQLQASDFREPARFTWAQFRERYKREVMESMAVSTRDKINGVFDAVEEIISPVRLRDVNEQRISHYQAELRCPSDPKRTKLSEDTIKGHLAHLQAALRWAARLGLLPKAPLIDMPRRAKGSSSMKGRPLGGEEFDRLLAKVPIVLYPRVPKPKDDSSAKSKRQLAMQHYHQYLHLVATIADDQHQGVDPAEIQAVSEAAGRSAEALATDVQHARETIESWRHYLRGMWCSGLRLEESLVLYWDRPDRLCIDLDGEHPMLRIPAELEKGHRDRLLPIAPEFAEFLLATPVAERTGPVFRPRGTRIHGERLTGSRVGTLVRKIGRAAGVKVHVSATSSKVKYASVHDLRRSFGERWATRVMPQVLMELMRHKNIETTLKYYVGRNAQRTAQVLLEAHNRALASNSSSNSSRQRGASDGYAPVATSYPIGS